MWLFVSRNPPNKRFGVFDVTARSSDLSEVCGCRYVAGSFILISAMHKILLHDYQMHSGALILSIWWGFTHLPHHVINYAHTRVTHTSLSVSLPPPPLRLFFPQGALYVFLPPPRAALLNNERNHPRWNGINVDAQWEKGTGVLFCCVDWVCNAGLCSSLRLSGFFLSGAGRHTQRC